MAGIAMLGLDFYYRELGNAIVSTIIRMREF